MTDPTLLEAWFSFFTDDPGLRVMQGAVILLASVLIFLIFYTTRDILLRTSSLLYQLACIIMVAIFPIVGFLAYLLIRPARTVKQREMEQMLKEVLSSRSETSEKRPIHTSGFTTSEMQTKSKGTPKKKPDLGL